MRIVLANLKKPAKETRLAGKILPWLMDGNPNLQMILVGKPMLTNPGSEPLPPGIGVEDIFNRTSTLKNCLLFWQLLQKIRPGLVISPSPELVFTALLFKQLYPTQVTWDVQENHALNILYQNVYRGWRKYLGFFLGLAGTSILASLVQKRLYAERIYPTQFPFTNLQGISLENKAPFDWVGQSNTTFPARKVLFSGFISLESGILQALHWWKNSSLAGKGWTLEIIGYCPSADLRAIIEAETKARPEIKLNNLSCWYSDAEIGASLKEAFAVLAPYRETKANLGKIPTKFWEAGFLGRWIICDPDSQFLKVLKAEFPISAYEGPANDLLGFLEDWYFQQRLPLPNQQMGFSAYI